MFWADKAFLLGLKHPCNGREAQSGLTARIWKGRLTVSTAEIIEHCLVELEDRPEIGDPMTALTQVRPVPVSH